MRMGWSRFARKRAPSLEMPPDAGVTGVNPWLLSVAIIASTAALLGTTEADPQPLSNDNNTPTYNGNTIYSFERKSIDGGGIDLTEAAPSATFYVNIRADDLGPDGVVTTANATAKVDATITGSGFTETAVAPFVNFSLRAQGNNGILQQQTLEHFSGATQFVFSGNCTKPTEGAACSASVEITISRLDDGATPGTVHVEWLFDLTASNTLPSLADGMQGPLDPPWTVEVVR
jgi:hypothetical protein